MGVCMWKSTTQAINYEKVEPVPHGKTLGFLNSFLVDTTEFLNRFSGVCEQRLNEVSTSLQRLEVTMAILESKLESIPGLESVTADTIVQPSGDNSAPADAPPLPVDDDDVAPVPILDEEGDQPPAPEFPANTMTNREDPRYAKYFKMQRIGIAEPNIIGKMMSEGVDPDILSRPDEPSDYQGGLMESSEEGESEGWD